MANTIGIPQQKICGNIVAKIPILTALFVMRALGVNKVRPIIYDLYRLANNKILTIFLFVVCL